MKSIATDATDATREFKESANFKRRNIVVDSPNLAPENKPFDGYVLLIDHRALDRDCLARSLKANKPEIEYVTAASLNEWILEYAGDVPSAVVFVIGSSSIDEAKNYEMIAELVHKLPKSPLIIVSDKEELGQMLRALQHGARGFIPSSVGIDVAIEAISLARAGGVFLPASGLLAAGDLIEAAIKDTCGLGNIFTPREAEVADALRRGKANKIIAYDLNLCESTVKVHIRSIMKKLSATNRTEVAYKLREL
ncbi:response regulator transcription factor [Ahrensia sp. 13_GOM-1096m]|uniref:response regulator transcription factor n=1 Tax=Ahrensia sp. 13_GOM-1096m TaxID=1380380 RepID=UPI00047D272E|nr:response regulator transcription factor [Ahrensia sp. 13_GOM-1096m]